MAATTLGDIDHALLAALCTELPLFAADITLSWVLRATCIAAFLADDVNRNLLAVLTTEGSAFLLPSSPHDGCFVQSGWPHLLLAMLIVSCWLR